MIYKGYKFQKSSGVVPLHPDHWAGKDKNYVTFGRIVRRNNGTEMPTDAVRSCNVYKNDKTPVMAVPVTPNDPDEQGVSHSRTNMMYGADGRLYLMRDGKVYTAIWRHKK